MLIRFFSFDFDVGKYLTKAGYLQHLITCDEGEFDLSNKKRIFYLKEPKNSDYCLGLLLTLKDQKKFTTLQAKKIKVSEVSAGQDLIEVNYFIISKKSFRILFQYYHQSCSIHQFAIFLSKRHDTLAERWIANEEKKQSHLPANKKKNQNQLKKEFGRLFYSVTTRKEDLPGLMQELDKISSFEYPIQTLDVPGKTGAIPLADCVQRIRQKITFSQKKTKKDIINGLVSFISLGNITSGKVKGTDVNDVTRVISLIENNAYHAEYEFEELISKLDDGDVSDLENNAIIKELLAVAKTIGLHVKSK